MAIKRLKRTTQITVACGAFLIGLWLAHGGAVITIWAVLPIIILLGITRKRPSWIVALILFAVAAGLWRGQIAEHQAARVALLFGQKVQLEGVVADDPIHTDKNYTEFSINSQLPGYIKVRTHYVRLQRGYSVQVEGKLEPVLGNKTAQIGFASAIRIVSTEQNWLEKLRQRFFAGIRTALPEPLSSFGLGLLMGTRALIPRTLQDQLAVVGLSHLVAVSGYNLTILVDAMKFKKGSAFLKLVLPLWLIGTFCLITGFSASIVRAAAVSSLSLLAVYYGRKFKPMVLLGLAAVGTTVWQPSYLWADLGWQLSFLAFFGILVVAPAVFERFGRPSAFLAVGIESLAAQVMTAPLIAMIFKTASLVAPFTNVLVLPLIPLAMLFSLIAGLAGMLVPHSAHWIGLPANWLLQAIVSFVERSSQINWASSAFSLNANMVLGIYIVIVALVMLIRRVRYNREETIGELQI